MKKLFKYVLPALFIGILGIVLGGNISANASESSDQLLVKSVQTIPFPINTLPVSVQEEYEKNGWTITDEGAYREVTLTDGTIYVDEQEYDLESNGYVTVNSKLSVGKQISTDEHFMRTTNIEMVDGVPTAVFHVDMGELFDHMDSEQFKISTQKGYGDKYYTGDWVHCNRFNGPASDSVHYKKGNPKAWINFVGSDCDLALISSTVCWGHSYCNQSGPAGGCSIKIGHSAKFHKH